MILFSALSMPTIVLNPASDLSNQVVFEIIVPVITLNIGKNQRVDCGKCTICMSSTFLIIINSSTNLITIKSIVVLQSVISLKNLIIVKSNLQLIQISTRLEN